ncbi:MULTISPECIES: SDR family NAD(P)-dependent oxidoreductase [Pseudomonas]|uniref:SDR family NAD(P)-dependent oxidoreductase n=1 Tax=Pseudomonas auratipiscis TaxID=3115853 RepID=A0AB35WLL8_9PSED|nr:MULTISPECIES: SDR family NAD(P)-dependent oxidoreductase [unclassified Pseudomonas]MEE1865082.1 SDR family NAD(P)-dependent oxidoreductase [Pseudomonas sp. 120P]MEE1955977.1 SDR family NAD(P)-dependent oxidoreductase [Pseudomonas sp. 119P]
MTLLRNKVAIITGGASGIGRVTAQLFAREGARVVVADMAVDAGMELVEQITQQGGQACFQYLNVCREEDCAALVDAALTRYGRLDIAFNNAGIFVPPVLLEEQTLEQWQRVLEVNLTGVFNCMVPELQAMKERGGSIINTASIAGQTGTPGTAAYCASKHGVIGLTKSAALEYGKYGIRINALCPGLVATPMTQGADSGFNSRMIEMATHNAPLRRQAAPEELAVMALWLASDKSSYVTGAQFTVDGGATA